MIMLNCHRLLDNVTRLSLREVVLNHVRGFALGALLRPSICPANNQRFSVLHLVVLIDLAT